VVKRPDKLVESTFEVLTGSKHGPGEDRYERCKCYRVGALAVHFSPNGPIDEWPICHAETGIEIIRCGNLESAIYLAAVLDEAVDWSKIHRGFTPRNPFGWTPEVTAAIYKALEKASWSIPRDMKPNA
jgi:hypothetical protein